MKKVKFIMNQGERYEIEIESATTLIDIYDEAIENNGFILAEDLIINLLEIASAYIINE